MDAALVRSLIGPHRILGVSAKSSEQALKAQRDGADYLGTGAVYPTNTKVITRELGVEGLKEVVQTPGLYVPIAAIGGIAGRDRVRACLLEGRSNGIAVVSAVFGQPDVRAATAELLEEIKAAKREREDKC
jgi:thiamine-phosphate diphosphorylase